MRRPAALLALMTILLTGCAAQSTPVDQIAELPPATPSEIRALIASSDRPVVLNVWASWCVPCRSEAPLLRTAAAEWDGRVRFVGIDVRDSQDGARRFIAEFGLDSIEHYFDASGAIPADLGGYGVPLTFFFTADGTLTLTHSGVLDERTLAIGIDDLLRASP